MIYALCYLGVNFFLFMGWERPWRFLSLFSLLFSIAQITTYFIAVMALRKRVSARESTQVKSDKERALIRDDCFEKVGQTADEQLRNKRTSVLIYVLIIVLFCIALYFDPR